MAACFIQVVLVDTYKRGFTICENLISFWGSLRPIGPLSCQIYHFLPLSCGQLVAASLRLSGFFCGAMPPGTAAVRSFQWLLLRGVTWPTTRLFPFQMCSAADLNNNRFGGSSCLRKRGRCKVLLRLHMFNMSAVRGFNLSAKEGL